MELLKVEANRNLPSINVQRRLSILLLLGIESERFKELDPKKPEEHFPGNEERLKMKLDLFFSTTCIVFLLQLNRSV